VIRKQSQRKTPIEWSSDVAYAIGLLVTDGCLSNDGRHIDLTSADLEQLHNFKKCLSLKAPISYKKSGFTGAKHARVQFSDVVLYRFLLSIGLTPAKTKTIGAVSIPDIYFFDFLRGHHDGDGSFYSYWDKRWKSSFMFYTAFTSASSRHIEWLRSEIEKKLDIKGYVSNDPKKSVYQLKYAKKESLKVLRKMYPKKKVTCLSRKRLKIIVALRTVGEEL